MKIAVLGPEGVLPILVLLCIPSLGGGSLSVENGGGDFLRRVGSSELGLAIVSPLPGEWVNHKAFSVVLEVWSLERADFEVKVWLNEREVYNATAAPDGDRSPHSMHPRHAITLCLPLCLFLSASISFYHSINTLLCLSLYPTHSPSLTHLLTHFVRYRFSLTHSLFLPFLLF